MANSKSEFLKTANSQYFVTQSLGIGPWVKEESIDVKGIDFGCQAFRRKVNLLLKTS